MMIKKIFFGIMAGMLLLTFFSCYSGRDLERKYNQGYSEGNKAGYNRGHTEGYNTAKNEYEKQINELQNRITTMERNHRNSTATIEANHRNRIATMETNHRKEVTDSYNKGFYAGTVAMEEKILTQIELDTQQRIRNNKRNEVLFGIRRQ